jgi:hypothetical protein
MVANLDRFIKKRVLNKIFFMPKWSSLAGKKVRSEFRMHSKTGHKLCPKDDLSNTRQSGIRRGTVFNFWTGNQMDSFIMRIPYSCRFFDGEVTHI